MSSNIAVTAILIIKHSLAIFELLFKFENEHELLSFESFKNIVDHTLETIETHALLKKQYVTANQAPFINRKINKEIMKWSRLRNKFLNSKSDLDQRANNK